MSNLLIPCPTHHAASGECTCKTIIVGSYGLFTAAEYGKLDDVRKAIERNKLGVHSFDEHGYTALHYAAQRNHVDVVRYLLSKGAKVDATKNGSTALHRAAAAGRKNFIYIHTLVVIFISINKNAFFVNLGSREACIILVENGANVSLRDSSFRDFKTPLEKAIAYNHENVIEYLVNFETDNPNSR